MNKSLLAFVFCCGFLLHHAFGQSRIFIVFHSGSYMDKANSGAELVLNAGVGYEHDLADKLSISLAYRRLFYLAGIDKVPIKDFYIVNNFSIEERDTYTGNAIDYETKYFFDRPEEGYYFSTGASLQMMTAHVDIQYADDNYYGTGMTDPVKVGTFEQTFNLFPITLKLGKRYSGDFISGDLFFGYTFNLGAGSDLHMKYAEYLSYDKPNKNTFIFGYSLGIKF